MRAGVPEKLRALANTGERAVLLIHGDYGSGKSAVLRALEESPPAGLRAVYVPVPTLDFSGIARWCLDRLAAPATPDPAAALRTAAERSRVLLLVDDADRLALDVALALRQLERDANGGVAIAAACGSDRTESPPIVALGPPQRSFEVAAGGFERTAREVRGMFEEPAAAAAAAAPKRVVRPKAATAGAARRAALAASSLAASAPEPIAADGAKPARRPSIGVATAPLRSPRSTRTVPLSIALALCAVAFVLPAAFFAGFWLGRGEESAPPARESSSLPAVSAPAPQLPASDAGDRSRVAAAEIPARSERAADRAAPAPRAAVAGDPRAEAEPAEDSGTAEVEPVAGEPAADARPASESAEARSEVASAEAAPPSEEPSESAAPPDAPKRESPARTAAAARAPARERQRDSTPSVEPSWGAPTIIRVSPADEAN